MEGYDLLMIFWSGFLIFGLFMAYQDYRKWISTNEANKSLSLREIFSIFGQGIVFVTIALAGIIFYLKSTFNLASENDDERRTIRRSYGFCEQPPYC